MLIRMILILCIIIPCLIYKCMNTIALLGGLAVGLLFLKSKRKSVVDLPEQLLPIEDEDSENYDYFEYEESEVVDFQEVESDVTASNDVAVNGTFRMSDKSAGIVTLCYSEFMFSFSWMNPTANKIVNVSDLSLHLFTQTDYEDKKWKLHPDALYDKSLLTISGQSFDLTAEEPTMNIKLSGNWNPQNFGMSGYKGRNYYIRIRYSVDGVSYKRDFDFAVK